MIGAEVKHGGVGKGWKASSPSVSAVEGYPPDSSERDITTARRFLEVDRSIRRRIRVGLAQTLATQHEDFGVFDETIGDGCGNGGVEENVAPVGERRIGRDNGTSFTA